MQRTSVVIALAVLTLTACGPGRQAAWEEQPAAKAPPEGSQQVASQDVAAQIDAAWQKRDQRAELETAVRLLEAYTQANPSDAAALTQLSRALHLLGDTHQRFAGETDAMLGTFEKGAQAGELAMMASSPEFAEKVKGGAKVEEAVKLIPSAGQAAIYWYATNLGKFAAAKGFTTRLFYKDRIFAVMQHVMALDEKFFFAAPHRYFGAFYALAPAFAGGDMNKSKEHFERSLTLDERYLGTKTLYAEYYATKNGDKELFQKLLNAVKAADANAVAEIAPEMRLEQVRADRLLAQEGELF